LVLFLSSESPSFFAILSRSFDVRSTGRPE
jgi:hypothetical protein